MSKLIIGLEQMNTKKNCFHPKRHRHLLAGQKWLKRCNYSLLQLNSLLFFVFLSMLLFDFLNINSAFKFPTPPNNMYLIVVFYYYFKHICIKRKKMDFASGFSISILAFAMLAFC